ncbi:uncharacterized protein G2W53_018221 [Senna tora]|uniref:Retrotransposon gag domain-containing protein n=1 Tax=Senna tora TaxID=362788 RepID=A0A834TS83_9FABA|nr:uncharacterized protein G2W53_018221 [Senna tora]
MKPERVREEKIKLRAFPFSLDGATKDRLFYLPMGSITTWEEMMELFLERCFLTFRAINVRRDICGIKQKLIETLFDYWERFKRLCARCLQHDIPKQILIHYFYEGLFPTERSNIDSTSDGLMEANAASGTDLGRSYVEVTDWQGLRIPRLEVES